MTASTFGSPRQQVRLLSCRNVSELHGCGIETYPVLTSLLAAPLVQFITVASCSTDS
ncbi:MAG: hypothetical protein HC767_04035 [Akkermansiaceae bacterium]|nr:hypothetical protein [Akkermansiaceae bacterium]